MANCKFFKQEFVRTVKIVQEFSGRKTMLMCTRSVLYILICYNTVINFMEPSKSSGPVHITPFLDKNGDV